MILARGVVSTNQGSVRRDAEPAAYWAWVRRLVILDAACLAVLAGSYWLSTP